MSSFESKARCVAQVGKLPNSAEFLRIRLRALKEAPPQPAPNMHSIATALVIGRRGIAGVDLVALEDIG
jgi:hypothetical protein